MTYQLNKAIHPGVSVDAALSHLGMSQKSLAERSGLSEKTISQIINGEASISAETAVKFENVLGGSAAFWMNLDSVYKTTLIRTDQQKRATQERELANNFPYAELAKRRYVETTRDPIERVRNLWKFFGVDSLSMVPSIEIAAYRRGYIVDNDTKTGALATWLRCGELTFSKEVASKLSSFDNSELRKILPDIRSMTLMASPTFFDELQDKLASVGVGLIAVQYFPGTKASGATRWIGQNPIIQLSTYGRDADKIWFTLFHEIGHILLHGKKEQFISFTETSRVPEELEADKFARNQLIPDAEYRKFISNITCVFEANIISFAKSQKIDVGIVVGRMKKDKILNYPDLLHLHRKLQMREND